MVKVVPTKGGGALLEAREEVTSWLWSSEAKKNSSVPNLHQIVSDGVSYRNKVHELAGGPPRSARLASSCGAAAAASTSHKAGTSRCEEPDDEDLEERGGIEEPALVKETRDMVMEATGAGLVNKSLISALFLTFNIPSLLVPPMPVDFTNNAFMVYYISAMLAVAAGFYVILSGVFIATHSKAATVTQAMALAFSDAIAPWILMNHNVFIIQGLATSIQVAAVCISYSNNHWSVWFGIGACCFSLVLVSITKKMVNRSWRLALEAKDEDFSEQGSFKPRKEEEAEGSFRGRS